MFVIKRSKIVIVVALVLTFITFVICVSNLGVKSIDETDIDKLKIVLDAGHGGIDGGAIGVKTGAKESELNLKVVKKLEKYLLSGGFKVVLTRSTDAGLYGTATINRKKKDMQKRKSIIEKANPDLVISVHMNKFSSSNRRGAQVFYNDKNELGKRLANSVQNSFNSMEECVKKTNALKGDYYLLNYLDYPCIIAECGFLSNPEDELLLTSEEYQDKIAYAIFKGMIDYFSVSSIKFCY